MIHMHSFVDIMNNFHTYHRLRKWKPHTFTKLKHTKNFIMKIFYLYHVLSHVHYISVTHVLYNCPVKVLEAPKDGLLDPKGSLVNEVGSCIIEQANQCWLPFTNKWCPYTV